MKYYVFKASGNGCSFDEQRPIRKGLIFCKHDFDKQQEAIEVFEVKGKNGEERAIKWIEKALSDGFSVEIYTGHMFGRCSVVGIL